MSTDDPVAVITIHDEEVDEDAAFQIEMEISGDVTEAANPDQQLFVAPPNNENNEIDNNSNSNNTQNENVNFNIAMDNNELGNNFEDVEMRSRAASPVNSNKAVDNEKSAFGSTETDNDSDGFTCSICFEQYTNAGDHRICCLKCGHLYGRSCIEKWVRSSRSCPQCKCKAAVRDIRTLYVKSTGALDNSDLIRKTEELEAAQSASRRLQREYEIIKTRNQVLETQVKTLEMQVEKLKRAGVQSFALEGDDENSQTSGHATGKESSRKQGGLRFTLLKDFGIKEGPCRVGAYNEYLHMMVVSHDMKHALFPNGCCGIKQINMLQERAIRSMASGHLKQIRDMQFSLCQKDVLLSVSLDKKAILYNCHNDVATLTFTTDFPLWSCCWDETTQPIFYVGTTNGQVIAYDIRAPQNSLATFAIHGQNSSPICRLKYVRPSYQNSSFNLSGILVQKLDSVTFCEHRGGVSPEFRQHPLPIEGTFMNVDMEARTRHVLVSTRPSTRESSTSSHLVCQLEQYFNDALQENVVTSNVVRTYQGSPGNMTKLCRSSIFSPAEGRVFVAANGGKNVVKYWDIGEGESEQRTIGAAPDLTLDFVHSSVNERKFLGLVYEKGVRVFRQEFN